MNKRKWMCANCGYIYEQDKGDPSAGIAPGTAWEDIPEDWKCPDCGAEKSYFEMVEL
jgi:rubredoxin